MLSLDVLQPDPAKAFEAITSLPLFPSAIFNDSKIQVFAALCVVAFGNAHLQLTINCGQSPFECKGFGEFSRPFLRPDVTWRGGYYRGSARFVQSKLPLVVCRRKNNFITLDDDRTACCGDDRGVVQASAALAEPKHQVHRISHIARFLCFITSKRLV